MKKAAELFETYIKREKIQDLKFHRELASMKLHAAVSENRLKGEFDLNLDSETRKFLIVK